MKQAAAIACGALAAACAAPALAQSSVTMFGVVDTAFAYGKGSTSHVSRMVQGGLSSSRLGFRGTEDLGGGLGAGFWVEMGINTDDGTGGASNSNNQPSGAGVAGGGLVFNRRSTVSLISQQFGELRLGRDFTAHYNTRYYADPFQDLGVGSSRATVATLLGSTSVRASNMVSYLTPSTLGGFFGQAQYFFGENQSTAANHKDGSGYSYRVGYAAGPWNLQFAQSETKYLSTATIGDTKSDNLIGVYDFGFAKVSGGVFRDRVERITPITGKSYTLGVTVPLNAWQLRAAISRFETNAPGNPAADQLALGFVYNLSTRTAIYSTLATLHNKGGATQSLNASVTGPNRGSRGLDVGLRHAF